MEASTRVGGTHAAARRGGRRAAAIATLAVGALAVGIAAALSHAEVRRTGTNDVTLKGTVATLHAGHRVCQQGERLPAGTATLALTATRRGTPRPGLTLTLLDAATHAPVAAGTATVWRDQTATVPLRPRSVRERAVSVCLRMRDPGTAAGAAVTLFGGPASGVQSATVDGAQLGGRLRLDYLQAEARSWWSFAPTVVRRIGFGHGRSGPAGALAAALLLLTSIALAAWLLVRTS